MRRWSFIRPMPRFWLIVLESLLLSVGLHVVFAIFFRYRIPVSFDKAVETGVTTLDVSTSEWKQQLNFRDPAGVLQSNGKHGYLSMLPPRLPLQQVVEEEMYKDVTSPLPDIQPFQELKSIASNEIRILPYQFSPEAFTKAVIVPWAVDLQGNRCELSILKDFATSNIKRPTLIRISRNGSYSVFASSGNPIADQKAILALEQEKLSPDNLVVVNWPYQIDKK